MRNASRSAASYVREYLKRGAIAPPDACDRCACDVQISPSHPIRKLHPWHPDPTQRQVVAWLCTECWRRLRSTREPLTLTWTWPGITSARSRKAPNLSRLAAATAAAVDAKLSPAVPTSMRDSAFIGTLIAALAPGERERLYAAGSIAGPRWRPTSESHLDALLRTWVFTERAARSSEWRAAGAVEVTPVSASPRRRRGEILAPPPGDATPSAEPFDAEANRARLERAVLGLDSAEAAADDINTRVAEVLRSRFEQRSRHD